MSGIHPLCASAESQLRAIIFTWREANLNVHELLYKLRMTHSSASCAARESSVVQTGVKSAGCENIIAQLNKNNYSRLLMIGD